jgi:hypothetical protein
MKANGVEVSRGSNEFFQNQVIERFNRTFKLKQKISGHVKELTGETISLKGPEAFKVRKLELLVVEKLVKQAIEEYNNKKHIARPIPQSNGRSAVLKTRARYFIR